MNYRRPTIVTLGHSHSEVTKFCKVKEIELPEAPTVRKVSYYKNYFANTPFLHPDNPSFSPSLHWYNGPNSLQTYPAGSQPGIVRSNSVWQQNHSEPQFVPRKTVPKFRRKSRALCSR